MFVGSINSGVRSVLAEIAPEWRDRPVYVGCSGNFTVERVLHSLDVKDLHGNDVSLYSCAIGKHLAGKQMKVSIKDDEFAWMEPYLGTGVKNIALLSLSLEYLQWTTRSIAFHRRQAEAIRDQWDELYEKTLERVEKALEGMALKTFTAGDVFDHVRNAPPEAVCIAFPPTYEGGYEKLYAKMDSVFKWRAPQYEMFTDTSFDELTELMREKWAWVTLRDHPVVDLQDHLLSVLQTGMRSRPMFVYGGSGATRIVTPHQKVEAIPVERASGKLKGERLEIAKISQGQMNTLRSEYLSPKIVPAQALVNLAVLCDGKLIGAIAFDRPNFGGCDAYMMTDFAIAGTDHKRLSKLVLAAVLSSEVKGFLEQAMNKRVVKVVTTAFTTKPVSMKYKGVFELQSRKEDHLQYAADIGRWSLAEGLQWWMSKHAAQ
jgi:hypothetical protein